MQNKRRKPDCRLESSGIEEFLCQHPSLTSCFPGKARQVRVLPQCWGTETISQGLPALKQDGSCIKIDSSHFEYLSDTTISQFLATAKIKELLQVVLLTSTPSLERQTSLSSPTVNSTLRGCPSLGI